MIKAQQLLRCIWQKRRLLLLNRLNNYRNKMEQDRGLKTVTSYSTCLLQVTTHHKPWSSAYNSPYEMESAMISRPNVERTSCMTSRVIRRARIRLKFMRPATVSRDASVKVDKLCKRSEPLYGSWRGLIKLLCSVCRSLNWVVYLSLSLKLSRNDSGNGSVGFN